MWNGTAETLKARPAMMKTMPTTTPSETASPPAAPWAKIAPSSVKLVVPEKP